jgi:hypothetical protein
VVVLTGGCPAVHSISHGLLTRAVTLAICA